MARIQYLAVEQLGGKGGIVEVRMEWDAARKAYRADDGSMWRAVTRSGQEVALFEVFWSERAGWCTVPGASRFVSL
jgi:hypothetical protein